MAAPKKLDAQTETQVVAMIARGDTHSQIIDWLEKAKEVTLAPNTITLIKKRNAEAIQFMQSKLTEHETTLSTQILAKSRQLIDKRLDKNMQLEQDLRKLREKYESDEIDSKDYYREYELLMRNQLDVKELNAISKESFHQTQLESGKPTQIADNPAQAKANLATLLAAIKNRDDAAALEAIFPDD